jgi:hypothetical protein
MAEATEKGSPISTAEYEEHIHASKIEQGNGAVLLDLRGKEGTLRAAEHLKTAKDGYVCSPLRVHLPLNTAKDNSCPVNTTTILLTLS